MKKILFALFCAAIFAVSAQAQTIKVPFRNSDDTKSYWPFAEKKFASADDVTEATVTLKNTKYKFGLESDFHIYLNSKEGLMFGGADGNFMKLPAVKGKTLVKVSVKYGAAGYLGRLAVTDATGNICYGGDIAPKIPNANYVHTWEISGVKKGKPLFLTVTHDSVVKMKELVLVYE